MCFSSDFRLFLMRKFVFLLRKDCIGLVGFLVRCDWSSRVMFLFVRLGFCLLFESVNFFLMIWCDVMN